MKNSPDVSACRFGSAGRFGFFLFLVALVLPALREAQAGLTQIVGSNGADTVDSTDYTDPTYSNLIKGGTNMVSLTGTNTYTGLTGINSGTLQIGNGGTVGSILGNVANSSILSFNRSDGYTFAGNIGGAGEVQQNGGGTLTLSGDNLYSGGTTVNSGALTAGSDTAFGTGFLKVNAGTVDLGGHSLSVGSLDTTSTTGIITNTTGSSTLTTSHSTAATFGGTLQDGGGTLGLTKGGTGSLTLTGTNTYSGGTTVSDGALQIGNGGTTGSIAGNVSLALASSILNFQRSDAVAFTGVISGSGQVVQSGSGTLTLSGANNYTEGTTLSGGGLNINNATALGSGTLTIIGAGTHVMDNTSGSAITLTNNNAQSWSTSFTFTGSNNLNLGTGAVSINNSPTVTVTAGQLAVGGVISSGDSSAFTKAGNGELLLTADETYAGDTTISAGTLHLGANSTGGSVVGAIIDNGHLIFDHSNSPSVNNAISGSGDLTKNGSGNLTLSGNNSYSGGTTVNTGTLVLGSATALGTGSLSINNTSIVDLHGNSISVGGLAGAAGTSIKNDGVAASTLTVSGNTNSTDNGAIQDGTGTTALTKSGSGALTLNGTNTYTGDTTLNGGTLNLGSASAIGTGKLTIAGASSIDNTTGSALVLTTNNAQAWNASFTFRGTSDGTHDLNLGTGAVSLSNNPNVGISDGTLTVGGDISGTGVSLTKSGVGRLVLTGTNTYTGTTIITGGELVIGNGGANGSLNGSGGIIVTSQITFDRSGVVNVSNQITGQGSVTKNGSGNLVLSGNNFYSGGTFLNDGKITLGSGTALGTNSGGFNGGVTISAATLDLGGQTVTVGSLDSTIDTAVITNSGTAASITTDSFSSANFSGIIQDGGPGSTTALIKKGTGNFTLSGLNTFSGGTTLNAGTLTLGSSTALGQGSLLISGAGAKLDSSVNNLVIGNNNAQFWNSDFTFKGSNNLDLGLGQVTLNSTHTVTVLSHSLTVGGIISGPTGAGLTKDGLGTLVLTGANDYSGTTTINAGILQIGNGSTGQLGTGNVVDNGSLVFKRSNDLTVSNAISGTGSVTKDGAGILILSGVNTYTGGTVVSAGTLQVGNASALGGVAGGLTLSGGTVDLRGFNLTVGTLSGASGTITSNTLPGVLTVNGTGSGGNFSGGIQDGASGGIVSLVKNGTGVLTLGSANTYSGGTTLIAGTLELSNSSAIGSGALTITGGKNPILASGSDLTLATHNAQFWNTNFEFNSDHDLSLGDGAISLSTTRTVAVTGAGTFVVDGNISGIKKAGLTVTGGGTLLLNGNNTYLGATTVTSGLLQIGPTATLGAGKLVDNDRIEILGGGTFANVISGKGSLIQNNAGNLTLSGTNTYSGRTSILQGTITVGNLKALGTGPVTFDSGTLDLNGLNLTIANLASSGTGTGGLVTNGTATPVTLTVGGKATTGAPLEFSGVIEDGTHGGVTSLVKTGTSTLTLSGTNTFSGNTTLSGGTLNINSDGALSAAPSLLIIAKTATLGNTSGADVSVGNDENWNANFTFQGPNDLTLAGDITMGATRTVTVTGTNTLTVSGVISGTTTKVGLTKAGPGTLILTGDNSVSYVGATTIKAGTLQIGDGGALNSAGKIANTGTFAINRTTNITISNPISGKGNVHQDGTGTTTLTGTNTYTGGTVVNDGTLAVGSLTALGKGSLTLNDGNLQTGNGIHQINVTGNLNWNSDAVIHLTLTPDATSEFVNVTDSLVALDGGPFTFDFTPVGLPPGTNNFLVMTVAKGLSGFTTSDFGYQTDAMGFTGSFRIDGNNLWFDDGYEPPGNSAPADFGGPQPVPEPSTWMMLILGGIVLVMARRRRAQISR